MIRILVAAFPFFLAGCAQSHIYSSTDSVSSPDKRHTIHMTAHGQGGRSYFDVTVKKVLISVVPEPRSQDDAPFETWAVLEAGDLSWTCTWLDPASIRLELFDEDLFAKTKEGKIKMAR